MSGVNDRKLNAIKEIEFRINKCKEICSRNDDFGENPTYPIEEIDNLLFDINDFINDLKDE